jgi:glycosyltransferase involved in cell wall biosynthesis
MKIFIDPRSTINYTSFYIKGLYDVFGKKNVRFSEKYFKTLPEIDMLMAFVAIERDEIKKIIIDYRDQNDVINNAWLWADIYAKINVNKNTLPDNASDKLVCIPPSFAIKLWNPCELIGNLFANFVKAGIIKRRKDRNIHLQPVRWIRNYLSLLKRQKLEYYEEQINNHADSYYVFFVSTFWSGCVETNTFRKHYILSCSKNPKINYEGGFFIKGVLCPNEIPPKLRFHKFVPNSVYMEKIKKSRFVFNTPAVCNCHGWKLGEFLCMGKAIISTPLDNELPEPLIHGEHIYLINDIKEMDTAVNILLNDNELLSRLEKNAKDYYNKFATPAKVIERIMNKVSTHCPKR